MKLCNGFYFHAKEEEASKNVSEVASIKYSNNNAYLLDGLLDGDDVYACLVRSLRGVLPYDWGSFFS